MFMIEASLVVMFISKEYVEKVWTRQERRAALTRARKEADVYVLPVRFDDSLVPGLNPDAGYQPEDRTSPSQLADDIVDVLRQRGYTVTTSIPDLQGWIRASTLQPTPMTVTVVDQDGATFPGARIVAVSAIGTHIGATTDGRGVATLELPTDRRVDSFAHTPVRLQCIFRTMTPVGALPSPWCAPTEPDVRTVRICSEDWTRRLCFAAVPSPTPYGLTGGTAGVTCPTLTRSSPPSVTNGLPRRDLWTVATVVDGRWPCAGGGYRGRPGPARRRRRQGRGSARSRSPRNRWRPGWPSARAESGAGNRRGPLRGRRPHLGRSAVVVLRRALVRVPAAGPETAAAIPPAQLTTGVRRSRVPPALAGDPPQAR